MCEQAKNLEETHREIMALQEGERLKQHLKENNVLFQAELKVKMVKKYWVIHIFDQEFIARTPNGIINQLSKYLKGLFNNDQPEPEEKGEDAEAL